ncbi:FG-GAP repeat protein [candidate division KSB1 bacterium]|nr:FG-GAP repeat protein [candidate division KSB1 bacterium]
MKRAEIGFLVLILAFAVSECIAQPYQPHVIWDRSGQTDSSAYGYKILPLGDQNDDGFADWAVYAQGNGGGWNGTRASYLEFFFGGESLSTMPAFILREDSTVYSQLWYADIVGDLNGDGYMDWKVNFWLASHPPMSTEGIFFGGNGFSVEPGMEWTISFGVGLYPLANFYGQGSGDFNGDGFDDLFEYDFNSDVARIYFGGTVMDTVADWTLFQPPSGILQTIPYSVGDFNGDGASDFLCFNPNPPFNAAIFLGGSSPDTVPAYFFSNVSQPLGGVKSLNGDAYDEFLFSAVNGAEVHFGRDSLRPDPDTYLSSGAAGYAVSAGDFNHDGYQDLVLFAPDCFPNMFGCMTLHLGHPWIFPNPTFEIQGSWPNGLIGIYAAAGLGDVNGDGIDDIAVGAWDDFAYLGWRGRCVIIAGDDSLIADADDARPELPNELSVEAYPNPFNSEATVRLQLPFSGWLATLTIFNVLGKEVRRETLPPFTRTYAYHLRANDLPSGVYFVHVEVEELQATQKLMLLK